MAKRPTRQTGTTSGKTTRRIVDKQKTAITKEQIRQRAYEIFLARGATPGNELLDWLEAESELQAKATTHR
jgi:hypothetical protein